MLSKSTSAQSALSAEVQGAQETQTAPLDPRSAEQFAELERLLGLCEVQAVRSGLPFPLGAHASRNGVNFAIFSRHATGVRLDLFNCVN
jgi:hypothetical protein